MNPEQDVISPEELEDESVYNLNMFSVLSWRFSARKILKEASNDPSNKSPSFDLLPPRSLHVMFIVWLFRFLPLVLVWCEVVVLIGILDEGEKIKYLTEHDKTFQFPRFIWSKTAPQTQCEASNEMKSWFLDQQASEFINCAFFGPQLSNFSRSVNFASEDFFNQYAQLNGADFSVDLSYVLTHCFPWAYSELCANLISARPNLEAAAAARLGGCNSTQYTWETCAYRNCYLPTEASFRFGGAGRISADMWRNISVSWADVNELVSLAKDIETSNLITVQRQKRTLFLAAYENSEMRHVYEEHSDFICWFMKQMLNRRKHSSSDSSELSMYLFAQLHWVYALGVGETHIVELIAIVFLSFYVYMTAMYDELVQLLYQLRAHGMFSGHEYVRQLMFPDPVAHRKMLPLALRYLKVVWHGIFNDIFLSLRIIYYACMVQATAMMIGWDHGVIEVVIAALAITFLLEIDDKMMIFVRERLAFSNQHNAIFSGYKGIIHRIVMSDKLGPRPFAKDRIARSSGLKINRTESMLMPRGRSNKSGSSTQSSCQWLTEAVVIRLLSLALLAGVLGLHLEQTCQLSTKVGLSDEIPALEATNVLLLFQSFQTRMVPLSAGVLAVGCVFNLLILGPSAVLCLVQLCMCLVWVVWAMYTGINDGLLFDLWNWFEIAVPNSENFDKIASFYGDGMLHSPSYLTSAIEWSATAYDVCFPLHILFAALSPALIFLKRAPAESAQDLRSSSQDRNQVQQLQPVDPDRSHDRGHEDTSEPPNCMLQGSC